MEMSKNQQKDKSVFVLMRTYGGSAHGALYKVKLEHKESGEANGTGVESSPQVLVPVIKFFDKTLNLPKQCLFEGVRHGSCSKLYLMVNGYGFPLKPITTDNSFVFDTDTDTNPGSGLRLFPPAKAVKPYGTLISAYGMLYYFAHPSCSPCIPDPSFERYNPATNLWESLPSCPYKTIPPSMKVVGYAVCYGCILFSMYNCRDCVVMAYHIGTEKWHEVKFTKSRYRPIFLGRAVVVDGIIYALSFTPNQVRAFSFWRDSDDNCLLGTPLALHVRNTSNPPCPILESITQNLVHLGRLDFCLIETGRNEYSLEHQYLCVTTFRIIGEGGGTEIRTLRSSIFQFDLMGRGSGPMKVNFSFTPDCEDAEPEEDYCPIAPIKSNSESKAADGRLPVATGRQQDLISIPTKVAILSQI